MLEKLEEKIKNSSLVKGLVKTTKSHSLIGFEGVPIYQVGLFFKDAILKGTIDTRASSVAFNFFMAIFPGILFLFTLIPFVPVAGFGNQLLGAIDQSLPEAIGAPIISTIKDLMENEREGLLIVNILMTLYFASNGFQNLMTQFNNTYLFEEKRVWWKQRLVAIELVLILTGLVLAALLLTMFTGTVIAFAKKQGILPETVNTVLISGVRWLVVFALYYFSISFLYYLGPAKRSNWKFFSAGSSFATVMIIITSVAFAYYVGNFSKYNAIYGSVGTILIMLLYFQLNSYILLLGFELNASIRKGKMELV